MDSVVCPSCGNEDPDAFDVVTGRQMCLNKDRHPYGLAEEMELRRTKEDLKAQLELVANLVDSWPNNPWIPGVTFRDPELMAIINEHRTAAPYNHSVGFDIPNLREDDDELG